MRKLLYLIYLSFLLVGCQTYTVGRPMGLGQLYEPSLATDYWGRIGSDPLADTMGEARRLCSTYGGLNEQSIEKELNLVGQSIWRFRCYPPQAEKSFWTKESYSIPEVNKTKPGGYVPGPSEVYRPDAGGYVPANTQANTSNQTPSIEEAKAKCADLGFKPKTEAFGKCVLKLSN